MCNHMNIILKTNNKSRVCVIYCNHNNKGKFEIKFKFNAVFISN